MGLLVGVDGGSTKTDLVALTSDGELVALRHGRGSNSHAIGSDAAIGVVAELVGDAPVDYAALFLCGADTATDLAELAAAAERRGFARRVAVENDTFALLRAGSEGGDAVAVVCGTGINCVGRTADGRTARYPSLGWETGDWGGSGMLGREVLFHAARAEDGRGEPTALLDLVRRHFGMVAYAVGDAVHYRRMPLERLDELAPAVVAAAAAGDAVARRLVERMADEVVLMVTRALRDLGIGEADVVMGGGMLRDGGFLVDEVVARLPQGARAVVVAEPPVVGAALAALDAVAAPAEAHARLRAAFADA